MGNYKWRTTYDITLFSEYLCFVIFNFTTRIKAMFLTQVSNINVLGESNICRVLVEGVAWLKPGELEGPVESTSNDSSTEHQVKYVTLDTIQLVTPFGHINLLTDKNV